MLKLLIGVAAACSLLFVAGPLRAQVQGSWVNTGNMNTTREAAVQVTLLGGKALVAGGTDGTTVLSSAEIYNASTGVWTSTGSMAEARESFVAVVLKNGKVLVVGGLDASNNILASAELYSPSTGQWSSAGALSVGRAAHTATLLSSGKVLIAGGCATSTCSGYVGDSELYDPVLNKWTTTGSMLTARGFHTATRLRSGDVLAVGGSDGVALSTCELYNPSTGNWQSAPSTANALFEHTATLLQSGKVLVTGGTQSRFPMSSAELYDPAANTWTLTGSMTTGRYAHTATLLTDGTVLVAGGEGQSISCGKDCTGFIPTAKAEIYNEAGGKFTATGSLNRARAYHTMTLLGTGRALADGGSGYTSVCCVVLNSAEIYTPLTLTFSSSSLNFGLEQVGVTSNPQTVTVTNASFHSATFTSITSSGDFAQTNNCPISPSTLNSGQSCMITVTFKPTTTGTRNGGVTLKDNAAGSPQQTISASGTGEPYDFGLSPTSLNFPSELPGNSSPPQDVTVMAVGAAQVNIASISISPADGTFTQTNNCPATLQPGQSCAVQIVFTPPDSGSFSATLSVSDSSGKVQTASLSGTGLD
jgi:Kelch motif/Galactose oxidase, central domain